VVRATEVHRYKIVVIENVVEAASWELFDIWLAAMDKLGYNHQFISVSLAHIGDDTNPHAPQWRDRLYIFYLDTSRRNVSNITLQAGGAYVCSAASMSSANPK
jgi:DNA (cytosine-5)-methyltransferase 1